jgi:multidrug resistance efflux pump
VEPLSTPSDIADSLEVHLANHTRTGSAVYTSILILVCGALLSLPLIDVGVSVEARGVIRPAIEKHEVRSGIRGFVDQMWVRENDWVNAGAAMLTLSRAAPDARLEAVEHRSRVVDDELSDLDQLLSAPEPTVAPVSLRTARLQADLTAHRARLAEIDQRLEAARRELERLLALSAFGIVPRAEMEEMEFAVGAVMTERGVVQATTAAGWRTLQSSLRTERSQLWEARATLEEEATFYTVTAPVTGRVEQVAGLSRGSLVQGGQQVAVISPSAELIAEVFLPPARFGLIHPGMPVRILVDSYNHFDWGYLTGRVAQLPDDYLATEGGPVFRAVVTLDSLDLGLSNGTRRTVGKGMTLRARFMVAERSLWRLLWDDINDWLNPSQQPE